MRPEKTTFADEPIPAADEGSPSAAGRPSLLDDAEALFEDGKTYLQAELAYQKSRAGFAGNRLKWAAAYGAMAFGLLHLALIAFTVGLVIALALIVGPWLATAIVCIALLLGGVILLLKLRSKIDDIRSIFDGKDP